MEKKRYHYKGEVLKIIDGDTIKIRVKTGFYICYEDNFRLYNYNAPEVRGPEREFGLIAKRELEKLLPIHTEVMMRTAKERPDKYGRWITDISWMNMTLSEYLIEKGYGVFYSGEGTSPKFDLRKPYPLK